MFVQEFKRIKQDQKDTEENKELTYTTTKKVITNEMQGNPKRSKLTNKILTTIW